jgi:hypothetical protein
MKKTYHEPDPLRQPGERRAGDFKAGREWVIQEHKADHDEWFKLEGELMTREEVIDYLRKLELELAHLGLPQKLQRRGFNVRLKLTLEEYNKKRTIEDIMDEAFNKTPRDPRSDEYKAGVQSVIEWRRGGIRTNCPYKTLVQQDAYFAGCSEGHHIADRLGIPKRSVHTGETYGAGGDKEPQ